MVDPLLAATHALRLNRSFPDAERFAEHLRLAASFTDGPDPVSGLPRARAWSRVRAEAQTAADRLADLARFRAAHLPAGEAEALRAKRRRLADLADAALLPAREVTVQLRRREGDRAHYLVVVDRQDLATGMVARYTLLLSDVPGPRIPDGELALAAREAFADRLELLGTQDAALAFAALAAEGLDVHEVTRGVVGPAVVGSAGPQLLPLTRPALSACLERASRDLDRVRIDDPLPDAVTLPAVDADFGLVAARKWAVAAVDRDPVRDWFTVRGLRALVYTYSA